MPTAKQNVVGPQVRRLRMVAELSQESLAAKLQLAGWDLSRGGLSKVEAGLRRVNDAEAWMLAKVLGCRSRNSTRPGRRQCWKYCGKGGGRRVGIPDRIAGELVTEIGDEA